MSSPAVTVIGSYDSPYVRKVLVCLDLKGIAYRIDPIVPFFGSDELTKPSPLRRIPVLIDDAVTLADSTVTCEYSGGARAEPSLAARGRRGARAPGGSKSSPTPAWARSSSGATSTSS